MTTFGRRETGAVPLGTPAQTTSGDAGSIARRLTMPAAGFATASGAKRTVRGSILRGRHSDSRKDTMTSREAVRAGKGAAVALHHGLLHRLGTTVLSLRGRHLLVIDMLLITISILLTVQVRRDGGLTPDLLIELAPMLVLPLAIRPLVNFRFGLYRRLWRHASVHELLQVVLAVVVGTAIALAFAIAFTIIPGSTIRRLPLSFWLVEFVFTLALLGGLRFSIRAGSEVGSWTVIGGTTVAMTPTLLFGAGRIGATIARSARREPEVGVRPVGFLDEDPTKHGNSVAGLTVYGGLDHLPDAIRLTGARMLLITLENPSGATIRRVMDAAIGAGLQVRTVPPVRGLFDGSPNARRVRDIRHGHGRRRLDRIGAGAPGLRVPTEAARPRRPGREPALHDPARARAAAPQRPRRR
jgi:hypothetical protein